MNNKIHIRNQLTWDHHRSGWAYAISTLNQFHNDNGILFEGCLDIFLLKDKITRPFVGVFHNTPLHTVPEEYERKYARRAVEEILRTQNWIESAPYCKGLFVLSEYLAKYLVSKVNVPVSVLYHPTDNQSLKFSMDRFRSNPEKKLMCIGHWMRNYHAFFDVETPYSKYMLLGGATSVDFEIADCLCDNNPGHVTKIDFTPHAHYDELMSENIVFINLFDASANNIVIECMARNTPILVNKLDAVVEYLGPDYPMYYDDLREAHSKMDDETILATTEYLEKWPMKERLTAESFAHDFENSEVYKNMKIDSPKMAEMDTHWSIGPNMRNIVYQLAKLGLHKNVLEIGCHNGYSTSAWIAALDAGADFRLTLCDTTIRPAVREMAAKHPDKVTIREAKSEDVIDASYDLIFVDGDHSIPVVGRELMFLLRAGTKTIIAHDTMTPKNQDGIDQPIMVHVWGSLLLKQVYDNHKEYTGVTAYHPLRPFLRLGMSFYSRDEAITEQISKLVDKEFRYLKSPMLL